MLRRLVLRDFRNFQKLDVDIPATGLVIVGENGHGKTNLLEAISYLGLFRSIRGSRDADVVRFDAAAFHVRAELSGLTGVHDVSVGYERSTKRKKAIVDGVERTKLSQAFGAVPSVCFSPVDAILVAGGPAERRHYLDVTLALVHDWYLHALQHYRSALKQRNAALRLGQKSGTRGSTFAQIEAQAVVWESSLARYGAVLASERVLWWENYREQFTQHCEAIGERIPVTMKYLSADSGSRVSVAPDVHGSAHDANTPSHDSGSRDDSASVMRSDETAEADTGAHSITSHDSGDKRSALESQFRERYKSAFDKLRDTELRRGVTLVGPHRDDLQLFLGDRDLRTFGSAGQQRTAAIALRMLELETHGAERTAPMLLLDDPFAELDAKRSARILELLETLSVSQVILTVPREEDVPQAFTRLERRSMVGGALR